MQLLFLDVETTGLSPFKDQIIELAGVVVDFDLQSFEFTEVSKFESLIGLRKAFDEKTTRITGITYQEVINAKELYAVQKEWEDWLSEFSEVKHIVGHSIDFDLSFLNSEKWFLPFKYQIIDTLELSRILFGNLGAINQEYITEKLKLLNFESNHKHHRSLFDTLANIRVFKALVEKLQDLNYSPEITEIFVKKVLKLPISFFTKTSSDIVVKKLENRLQINQIDFNGNYLQPSLATKLTYLSNKNLDTRILKLLQIPSLSIKITHYLLQFHFLNTAYLLGHTDLKLHQQNSKHDYLLINFLMDHLIPTQEYLDTEPQVAILEDFESVVWKVGSLADNHFRLGKIVEYLAILKEFLSLENQENLLENIDKIATSYDFWGASVDKASRYGALELNLNKTEDEFGLKSGLLRLIEQLEKTQEILKKINFSSPILVQLKEKIVSFSLSEKIALQNIQVRSVSGFLELSWPKVNFDLAQTLESNLLSIPNLQIKTNLTEPLYSNFAKILKLEKFVPQDFNEELDITVLQDQFLPDFFASQIEIAKNNNQICVLLGGLNSSLKDSQKVCNENFLSQDYLVLGETGSLTKILSKIKNGFSGLVILKFNNLDYLLSTIDSAKIGDIFVLNQPYFNFHSYLEKYLKNSKYYDDYKPFLKKLFLLATIYKTKEKHNKNIHFVSNYR